MNTIICIEKVSRYMEGKFVERFKIKKSKIWVNKGIFVRTKERI